MTWLGHATAVVDVGDRRAITDPVLRSRLAHLRRVAVPTPPVDGVDVVLVTHAHRDHLDLPSLRLLDRNAVLVVPQGVGRIVARLGFAEVVEVVAGDVVCVAGMRVEATFADHPAGRGLIRRGPRAVGYLVGEDAVTYVCGDTGLAPELAELHGRADLALVPISGWGPRVPAGHLTPVDAARLLRMVEPRVCIPVHWGTLRPLYRRSPYPADAGAPERFKTFAAALAPTVEVRILQPGDSCSLE